MAARSTAVNRRSPRVTAMSPPRISRPWAASPARKAWAVDPAAAMAATPRARQARKMRKPRTPARNSRAAKRNERSTLGLAHCGPVDDHASVKHWRPAVGAARQGPIVGDQDQGGPALGYQLEH